MGNLLDTNVISQRVKASPDERVVHWFREVQETELYVSAISFLEIRTGIDRMPPSRKRQNLELWLSTDLPRSFAGRILPVDALVADVCGRLLVVSEESGHTLGLADGLIAATAKVHGLRVATLNRRHFERLGVELVEF